MASSEVRVLMLENVLTDAELNQRELRRAGIMATVRLVMARVDFIEALRTFKPDLVLADYLLPDISGLEALHLAQEYDPLLPVVIVTGSLNEETAADSIKAGAADYVTKERLARLGPAVKGVLEKRTMRQEKEEAERALRRAHDELEARVRLRTTELAKANEALRSEMVERNRITAMLRQREREFRTLVENSPDVIMRFDRCRQHIYINPAGERLTGLGLDTLRGKSMADLGMTSSYAAEWDRRLGLAFGKGLEQSLEYEYAGTGGKRWFHARLVPEKDDQLPAETVMAISHDITDIKHAELELAKARETAESRAREAEEGQRILNAIMDCIPEGITVIDASAKVRSVNRFVQMMTGIPRDRFLGMSLEQQAELLRIHHADGLTPAKLEELPLSRALYHGETVTNQQFMYRRDGEPLYISANAAPVLDDSGVIRGAVVAWRDITQNVRNERALRHAMEFEKLVGTLATNFINLKSIEIDNGLENALRLLGRFSEVDAGCIWLFQNGSSRALRAYRWSSGPGIEESPVAPPLLCTLTWLTDRIRARKVLQVRTLSELPPEAEEERAFFACRETRAFVAVPMMYGGSVPGFLLFESRHERCWGDEEIKLLRVVVTMFANALERKRTENARLDSERRYRAIFENTGTAMAIVGKDEVVHLVNSEFEKLSGYGRSEIEGRKSWKDFFSDRDRDRLVRDYFGPVAGGGPTQPGRFEATLVDRQGQLRDVLLSASVPAELDAVVASVIDIGDRRRWESALRESEERLQLVTRNSPDLLFQQDRNQRYIWASRTFDGLAASIEGKTDRDLFAQDEADRLGEVKRRVLATGRGERGEFELTLDGRRRFLEVVFEPWRDAEERIAGILGYVRDVTERRQWEEQLNRERERAEARVREAEESRRILEAIMDQTPEGLLVVFGGEDRIRMMSQYARSLIGSITEAPEDVAPQDRAEKWGFLFLDGHSRPRYGELPLERAMEQGEVISDEEWIIRRPDATTVIVSISAGPILDPSGRIVGAVSTWRDITDRRNAEEAVHRHSERLAQANQELVGKNRELDELNEKLKELDKLKSEFVSMASHELRTPLTGIIGFAETLLAKDIQLSEDERTRYLQTIESEGKRLGKLIGEMLDVSKIETGISEMRFRRFGMGDLVSETVSGLAVPAGVEVDVRASGETLWVTADRDRIKQVLLNLLDNAIRYVEPKGRVSVTAMDGGDMVQVGVSDTGPGIGPEDLGRIFDKFYRNKRADTKKSTGSGLGLAIAKSIVEAHAGRIWAESELGKGSTFYFTIAKEPPKWLGVS